MDSEQYEYIVEVVGAETFKNILAREGLNVGFADGSKLVEFTSDRLLDMKGLRQKGIIRAYRIAKVKITKEPIEEVGFQSDAQTHIQKD